MGIKVRPIANKQNKKSVTDVRTWSQWRKVSTSELGGSKN